MSSSSSNIVVFKNPPVVETALSVQFEALSAMRSVHMGLFWNTMRDRFPKTQDQPALDPIIEQQEAPASLAMQFSFQGMEAVSHRLWMLNDTETEMMQIQNDRFIKNWRKNEKNPGYPRYTEVIKPTFESDFHYFQKFVENEKLGSIKISQCEVTYVNHIVAGEGWNNLAEIDKIFTFWKQPPASPFPGHAAEFAFRTRFPILQKGEWVGWLHFNVQPAINVADGKPMYAMTFTARGIYGKGYEFLDIGREAIVKSFENLTTETMQKDIWGKQK